MAVRIVETTGPGETESLGAELAGSLREGDVVLVQGELGAGKTTLVRGAARALGVTDPVTSPSFSIGHRYLGGHVTVSGEVVDAALRVRIQDTGIGMRAQDIPLVLQPFYRVNSVLDGKHQGAGLGLPFAKSVVELHGGTLGIESELGSGTTVTITLPLVSWSVPAIGDAAGSPTAPEIV